VMLKPTESHLKPDRVAGKNVLPDPLKFARNMMKMQPSTH
jgi:hypothetical protein